MSGNGKRPARIPPQRRAVDDALITSPWFGPPRLASSDPKVPGRPWILTFVGIDQSFVERLFEGVTRSGGGYLGGAFPQILAMRDFSEPPRPLLNGDGSPAYVRSHVEPTAAELAHVAPLPLADELVPDNDFPNAKTVADLLPAGAVPLPGDAAHPSWLRKLYLPMHQHFHVVACQIDCKRPGQPRIDPKRVTEAGMVVRRFIADPAAIRPRWEDWIPSPHGDGIWAEIADVDLITLNGTKRAVDPAALPADVFGARQAETYARLGVDKDPKVALGLSISKLATFPASLGDDTTKHTARWGFLPTSTSDKERQLLEPLDDPQAIASAFAAAADKHFTERISAHDLAICAEVRAASLPILQGLYNALPPRPDPAQVALALAGMVGLPGSALVADKVGFDALLGYVRTVTSTASSAQARWSSQVTATQSTPESYRIQTIPAWAFDPSAHDALTITGLHIVWQAMDSALPGGTALGATFDPRLLLAALGWVRANRVALLARFYFEAFSKLHMPAPEDTWTFAPDGTPPDPTTGKLLVIKPRPTVGAVGRELDAWRASNTPQARALEPVPWRPLIQGPLADPTTDLPNEWLTAHEDGSALERAIESLDAQGTGTGGAYSEVLDDAVRNLAFDVETNKIGFPLHAQGLDLNAQPERGFVVFKNGTAFPGPAPTPGVSGSLGAVKSLILQRYSEDASALPDAMRVAGKAARQVVRTRYDANNLYAVWSYARVVGRDPCDEPQLVWSRRTETFQLAEPMDLLGLKPVAFQLPDLPKLIRDIPRMPKARALPFAAITTPHDSGVTTGKEPGDTARSWGVAWICSFGIPIFTICAWILFQIILSILLVIPGFAWMLLLKFCIPVPVPKRS